MAKRVTRQSKLFRDLRGYDEYKEWLAKVRAAREAKAAELRKAAPIPPGKPFSRDKKLK